MDRIAHPRRSRLVRAFFCLGALHLFSIPDIPAQSGDAAAQRESGLEALRAGQFGTAVAAYRRALELEPGDERLYLELADIFLAAELPEDAESVLAEAARRFPASGSGNYNLLYHDLAELWVRVGRIGKASEAMTRASRVRGPVAAAIIHKRIGDFNTDLLRFDEALGAYRQALELDPGNAGVRLALGNLHLQRNSLDEALSEFNRALLDDSGSAGAFYGIAEVCRRRGQFEEAARAADSVLERVPGHRGAIYIRGMALLRLGRREEGERAVGEYRRLQALAQAEEHRQRDIRAFRSGAMQRVLGGEYAEAIDLLEEGIVSYPDAPELYLGLGQAQSESGRHRDAIDTFLRWLDLGVGPSHVAHQNLAREYLLVGDREASDRHQALSERELAPGPAR